MTQKSNSHGAGEQRSLDELAAYSALSQIAFADRSLPDTLEQIAGLAQQALQVTPEVSVTLLRGNAAHGRLHGSPRART